MATVEVDGLLNVKDKDGNVNTIYPITKAELVEGLKTMGGASASAAGKAGLVPAPAAGKQTSFLRGDGTWVVPANTTYAAMTGATTSAAGKAGLAPAPAAGAATRYLRSDGTWQVPPDTNTTYSAATTSAAGLMSAADKTKLNGIATGATKTTVDSALSSTSANPVQNKVVKAELDKKLPLAGGTMTGAIAMGSKKITGLATPTATADAATKGYVDTAITPVKNITDQIEFVFGVDSTGPYIKEI